MSRLFWSFVYSVYGTFGGIRSRGRSRKPEIYCFLFAGMFTLVWGYALATNLSANIEAVSSALILIGAFVTAGLFFRHVRLRSEANPHYLSEKRRAH